MSVDYGYSNALKNDSKAVRRKSLIEISLIYGLENGYDG